MSATGAAAIDPCNTKSGGVHGARKPLVCGHTKAVNPVLVLQQQGILIKGIRSIQEQISLQHDGVATPACRTIRKNDQEVSLIATDSCIMPPHLVHLSSCGRGRVTSWLATGPQLSEKIKQMPEPPEPKCQCDERVLSDAHLILL